VNGIRNVKPGFRLVLGHALPPSQTTSRIDVLEFSKPAFPDLRAIFRSIDTHGNEIWMIVAPAK
jgi:hypothetical protein